MLIVVMSGAVAMGAFGTSNRAINQRLNKIKNRHSKSQSIIGQAKRSLIRRESSTPFDLFLNRFIPRPQEVRKRLIRTGLPITLQHYAIGMGASAVFGLLLCMGLAGLSYLPSLMVGLLLGLAIPHIVIGQMISKRRDKFTKIFPEAIDLMVRGLKAGLPITESIFAVGREMPDPVGVEFRKVADDIKLGKTLAEALWKASSRLETQDFKFFVISLTIQQETGGNLAETLENLSTILRGRQQLKLKIKAMSSEGRASAYIIGALPFIMFGLIYMMNSEYASVLLTDPRGQIAMIGAMIWMGIGMFIISKMINFEL
ncbi:MAG: pilus assembly protein TadB [Kordiimonas sp.]|nr:pilus assembly protein TadB [Kordiimonas sp.]